MVDDVSKKAGIIMGRLFSRPWSRKSIRMVIGLLMASGFLNLSFTVYFFILVIARLSSAFEVAVMIFGFNYLWVPCVCLIVLCYVLLTRVWRYRE